MIVKMLIGMREKTVTRILALVILALKHLIILFIIHSLTDIPKILETPFVGEDKNNKKAPYRFEMKCFVNKRFDENLLDKIIQS